ncbi:DUF551 domain-containing protein [Cronobacter dublinensis]
MSTISKERLEEKRAAALLLTEYKHEDVRLAAQENVQVIDELLALRKEQEAAVPVAYPAPQDGSPGWKIDPEFISKVQDEIGYDEECQCWEGTPSMEMVEAVLLAASKLVPPPVAVPECFLNAVSALESLYRNGQKQCWHERYTTDMAYSSGVLNACRAAMLAAPGHDYKAIVERIAEILHGKVTDLDLLTVTVQAMKERVKEKHQMLMEDTVSRQELTRSLCDLLGVEPTYSLEALKEAIEKRGAEPWIQCSERMPEKYDRNIWLWDGDSAHCGYVWTGSSFADWNEEYIELKGVTHWMPMIVPLAPGKQVAETDTTSAEVEILAKDGE